LERGNNWKKGCFHIALLFFTKRREGDELNKKERGWGEFKPRRGKIQ